MKIVTSIKIQDCQEVLELLKPRLQFECLVEKDQRWEDDAMSNPVQRGWPLGEPTDEDGPIAVMNERARFTLKQ